MLILGSYKVWKEWTAAGVWLLMSPLTKDDRDSIMAELSGMQGGERAAAYQQAVAKRCVHGWRGVAGMSPDAKPVEVPFSPTNLAEFASIPQASDFILAFAQGLGSRLDSEVANAGNASSGDAAGIAAAAPTQ